MFQLQGTELRNVKRLLYVVWLLHFFFLFASACFAQAYTVPPFLSEERGD